MVNLELLNTIVNGIRSGELEHDQSHYHCIAGWVEVFELRRVGFLDQFNNNGYWIDEFDKPQEKSPLVDHPEDFARAVLGINVTEANLLFNISTPFCVIEKVTQLLNTDYRFVDGYYPFYQGDRIELYKVHHIGNKAEGYFNVTVDTLGHLCYNTYILKGD